MGIFSELESKIFKNEEALSPEYLPELLPHREQQIKLLARNILPAAKGRKPQNSFLYGGPGLGKTATVKYVFREFEEYSEKVKCIYVNCWDFRTASALLTQIIFEIGFFAQRRGWAMDEIVRRLVEALGKFKKSLVICLDEVDQLRADALYDLLRINQYVKNPVGVVFVSNNPHVFAAAEPRIRSSLAIEEIEFQSYSLKEMRDILQERAKQSFHSIEPAAVLLCANHAVQKGGDVRVGLQCLLKAGRVAEEENADKVKVKHVKEILRAVRKAKPEILKKRISETEKIILKILSDGKPWLSVDAYKEYCKLVDKPITNRAFRNYIDHLAELKLIKIRNKKVRGSRVISKV